MKKIYLACPYSHPEKAVRETRFDLANKAAAHLIGKGLNVLSPISHSHPIAKYMDNHNDSKFWTKMDLDWLSVCDEMVILMVPGWSDSKGISMERHAAVGFKIPVSFMNPITMEAS